MANYWTSFISFPPKLMAGQDFCVANIKNSNHSPLSLLVYAIHPPFWDCSKNSHGVQDEEALPGSGRLAHVSS